MFDAATVGNLDIAVITGLESFVNSELICER